MGARLLAVAAILRNSQGEILLQQRDNTPGLPFVGYWTLPGGKVEDGETPDEAVHRELIEEIGLDVPLKRWAIYDRPGPNRMVIAQYVYTGRIDQEISRLAVNEGQELRYVDLRDFPELPIAYGFGALLKWYFGGAEEVE